MTLEHMTRPTNKPRRDRRGRFTRIGATLSETVMPEEYGRRAVRTPIVSVTSAESRGRAGTIIVTVELCAPPFNWRKPISSIRERLGWRRVRQHFGTIDLPCAPKAAGAREVLQS